VDDVATNDVDQRPLVVPDGANKLRVVLVWDDPAAAANASPALVNNLDLSLQEPGPGRRT
jgi:hypothetical protein